MSKNNVLAVIPARYASTRFPAKPLALIAGKPMIQWTYESACKSKADIVVVATDDQRIADCVESFGGRYVMTSTDHPSGTDRIAEAVKDLEGDLIVNLQGDEPLLPAVVIDELIDTMLADPSLGMGTAAVPVDYTEEIANDPNLVKVTCNLQGQALYFSRSCIPHFRYTPENPKILTHWGIYAYRRATLEQFITWPQSPLEQAESLEQLRVLENGVKIHVVLSDQRSIGVDVPDDILKVEKYLKEIS